MFRYRNNYLLSDDGTILGVISNRKGYFSFTCCHSNRCGDKEKFTSRGWPTLLIAKSRGLEHINEHEVGVPMMSLEQFRSVNAIEDDGTLKKKLVRV